MAPGQQRGSIDRNDHPALADFVSRVVYIEHDHASQNILAIGRCTVGAAAKRVPQDHSPVAGAAGRAGAASR